MHGGLNRWGPCPLWAGTPKVQACGEGWGVVQAETTGPATGWELGRECAPLMYVWPVRAHIRCAPPTTWPATLIIKPATHLSPYLLQCVKKLCQHILITWRLYPVYVCVCAN